MNVEIKGQIGETNDLFTVRLPEEDLHIDLSQMTYISSIGVKNWIVWTGKIPKASKVFLHNCPFVIISQANTVKGFVKPGQFFVDSFKAAFVCTKCNAERSEILRRGTHFEYLANEKPGWFKLPDQSPCDKCKSEMEPDFIEEKAFKFLNDKPE